MVTLQDNVLWDTSFSGPLRQRHRLAAVSKMYAVALVVGLLFKRSPSHIARLIVAVYVQAVNCVQRARTRANIFQERLERFAPTGAHRYPAPAIDGIAVILGIMATALDMMPDAILGHAGYSIGPHMAVAIVAAAALLSTATQERTINDCDVAAIAATKPKALSLLLVVFRGGRLFDNRQSPVTVADLVLEGCTAARGMMGLHHNLLCCGVMPWDVDASPGRFYSACASPLYHNITECTRWPMEARIQSELGVSVKALAQQVMEAVQ